ENRIATTGEGRRGIRPAIEPTMLLSSNSLAVASSKSYRSVPLNDAQANDGVRAYVSVRGSSALRRKARSPDGAGRVGFAAPWAGTATSNASVATAMRRVNTLSQRGFRHPNG